MIQQNIERLDDGDTLSLSTLLIKSVCFFTLTGRQVKTFGDIDLYSTKGGMSIYGDTLAIAGWGQQCYQLYKMYY